jgi:hypothetical protein
MIITNNHGAFCSRNKDPYYTALSPKVKMTKCTKSRGASHPAISKRTPPVTVQRQRQLGTSAVTISASPKVQGETGRPSISQCHDSTGLCPVSAG